MANVNIPKQAVPALSKIVDLSQKDFDLLLSILESEAPTLSPSQFVSKVSPKLEKLIEGDDLFLILATVLPLYAIKEKNSVSVEKLADDIGLAATELEDEQFPSAKVDILKGRLKSLLGLDKSLAVIAKANEVMIEHERIFCDARILSDIRSIFTKTPDAASGAMVVHMLQIGFHQLGKHHEFYVAMDNIDLKKLKESIERAEKKTLALKLLIENSKVPYLEV